jgi:hypothetical protein
VFQVGARCQVFVPGTVDTKTDAVWTPEAIAVVHRAQRTFDL